MNYSDKIKYERLKSTFRDNFALTRLYADYLEMYPGIITSEMVETLTESKITKEEAIVALLSEIFGLDFSKSEDRHFIMNYLAPSIHIMNAEKYTNNPYYKKVKIPKIKRGNWEFKSECYKPYRGVIVGDMEFWPDMREIPPLGFFTEEFHFPAVLENDNEWMTLTPVDLDTCEEAIEAARGRVVTFGLGLGYYTFMVSEKDNVDSITVVEKSEEVIKLFREYILPYFTHPEKVHIVLSDAFEYAENIMPKEHFDLAFADTWRDAGDGAPMYQKMKRLENLSPDTEFMYWIENFLISRIRAEKFSEIEARLDEGDEISYDEIVRELTANLIS